MQIAKMASSSSSTATESFPAVAKRRRSSVVAPERLSLFEKKKRSLRNITAQWFTIPQFIVKFLELIFSATSLVLIFLWESQGVRITTLNQDEYNYRNYLFYFVGVLSLSIGYSLLMTALGCIGVWLPKKGITFLAGVCVLLWLLANSTMSATLTNLSHSSYARRNRLNLLFLQIALVFGFLLMGLFIIDILLGFTTLSTIEDEGHSEKTD